MPRWWTLVKEQSVGNARRKAACPRCHLYGGTERIPVGTNPGRKLLVLETPGL